MCFSASASFIASGGLTAIGKCLAHHEKKRKLLAIVPILFGIQQFFEGVQWIVDKPSLVSTFAAYGFLFFAFVVWPAYVPIVVLSLERNKQRKKVLQWFKMFGIGMSISLFFILIVQPLQAEIFNHSIQYIVDVPFPIIGTLVYIAIVVGSLFLSSDKYIRLFGLLLLISAGSAHVLYAETFASTWCFFAAVLSALIYVYLIKLRPKYKSAK